MRRFGLSAALLLFVAIANDASAQGFIAPFIGTTLTAPTSAAGASKPGFGVALGSLGKIVGAETEFAYFPEVLDNSGGVAKNKVVTYSATTLIGPTIGPVKVFGAFGAGGLYLNVTSATSIIVPTAQSISNNYFAINYGGGVVGFFSGHFGARGDLRYFRAFGIDLSDYARAGLALNEFKFWRAHAALAIKF